MENSDLNSEGRITAIVSLPIAERVLKRVLKNVEAIEGLEDADEQIPTDVRVALEELQDVMKAMGIKSRERGESPVVSIPKQSA